MNVSRTLAGLLALVLTSLGLVVMAPTAWACSCVAASTAEHVERADMVAHVVVTKIERPAELESSADLVHYTVEPTTIFKGVPMAQLVVGSASSGASCGLEGVHEGDALVLFAHAEEDGWTANLCGGTAPPTPELVNELTNLLGPGVPAPIEVVGEVEETPEETVTQTVDPATPPAAAAATGSIAGPLIVSGIVVAIGIGAFLLLRGRRA